ncbi:MAG: hypothetical protein LBD41_05260 [Clostridiales Family XIII bacterium]|jgi:hypothetical protein|nr:hypothetical protein [Clostridiales Family XIII bacterium]
MLGDEFDFLFNDTDMLIEETQKYKNFKKNDNSYSQIISPVIFPECDHNDFRDLTEDEILYNSKLNLSYAFSKILLNFSQKKESCCSFGKKNGQAIYNKMVELLGQISKDNDITSRHNDISIFLSQNPPKNSD